MSTEVHVSSIKAELDNLQSSLPTQVFSAISVQESLLHFNISNPKCIST